MSPPLPTRFAAEFIVESPGQPAPQRATRRRGMETHRKWIRNWMKRLPQGDEDWDNNFPSTADEICRIRERLTMAHVESRHQMDWVTILHTYASWAKEFDGRELQLHNMVMVAACHVAHSDGLPRDVMLEAMAKCISGGGDTLRSKRFALPKCIQIGDELVNVLGVRAYELPLRVNSYFTFGQHFTGECFPLLREEATAAHPPSKQLPSEVLRIPSLVFDLCGGECGRKFHRCWSGS
ncbi:hypothetical protein EDB81DRAFT_178157 [Dactylonectria macrodidyma]|uniref:Uncharacterized protein n=1 Tax=Dactylonectria macrodidyma TaxID=307937 RepID=A0A9P9FQZ0_9HYPO|nr:hypothetical protein EDB81DRAFT_178157 [Dactylonectria macrodidyma]